MIWRTWLPLATGIPARLSEDRAGWAARCCSEFSDTQVLSRCSVCRHLSSFRGDTSQICRAERHSESFALCSQPRFHRSHEYANNIPANKGGPPFTVDIPAQYTTGYETTWTKLLLVFPPHVISIFGLTQDTISSDSITVFFFNMMCLPLTVWSAATGIVVYEGPMHFFFHEYKVPLVNTACHVEQTYPVTTPA